ncbi:uncharacterized protein LOC131651345 [Vicia villosa]|uniref:uncharacterized protein LOC131651345 n=1 Tax=Vicia villosa TaxID=3911 RepID=UPI00273ABA43|nr:uncharacterized protein LOC131651345 [Vicia villosa]
MACHERLATKVRLKRLGLLQEDQCSLYNEAAEDINHLLFSCMITHAIWKSVLEWLELEHVPLQWKEEITWIERHTKGKGFIHSTLKIAIAETVYGVWMYRNSRIFDANALTNHTKIVRNIIDTILYRGWMRTKYRSKLALLMM